MKVKRLLLLNAIIVLVSSSALPACKAKTCDAASNVTEQSKSRKRVKNIGLFSKKEMRRKRWH